MLFVSTGHNSLRCEYQLHGEMRQPVAFMQELYSQF